MKIFREDSKIEKIVRDIEEYMTNKGIHIEYWGNGGLAISYKGELYPIYDGDRNNVSHFPRIFDDERIVFDNQG